MEEISKNTLRYIQPSIPKLVKDKSLRDELTKLIVESLPSRGVVYKGLPEDKDLIIMAEATIIYRRFQGKEKIYVSSLDNHFKPNPVQVGSMLDSSMYYTGELDSTIRDKVAQKFGFIGEDPQMILEILRKEMGQKT